MVNHIVGEERRGRRSSVLVLAQSRSTRHVKEQKLFLEKKSISYRSVRKVLSNLLC